VGEEPAAIRAFVALEIDPESARQLEAIAAELRSAPGAPRASWTPLDKMHVTLKFVPALPTVAIEILTTKLADRLSASPAPEIGPARLGAFPSTARASIVVAHLGDPSGGVAALALHAEEAAEELGLERERRRFRPHVTLARTHRPLDARPWLRLVRSDVPRLRATQITLFRSDLGPKGSVYVPLARLPFTG
jgi:2'-5' RNA ligase